ncbi:MAG TPA: hypothetical protein VF112_00785 [Candidatus Dormibacteraeota bacterium]
MRVSRLLGGLRSRRARLGAAGVLAVLGGAAGGGLTVAFVAADPQPIVHAAAATPADPTCSGLIVLICGSDSHSASSGGTTSKNQSQSGQGSKAHKGGDDEGDPDVRGCP